MQYDLVFEGGGAKGFVFVGAMKEFEKRGHTHGRLLGTSAGAITACLLAAGYRSGEMQAALKEKENGKSVFASFMGDIPPVDKKAVRASSIRHLLQEVNVGLIPRNLEDKLDDRLAFLLANNPAFHHLYSFMERGGWFSADAFVRWMTGKLDTGETNGRPRRFGDCTLGRFHRLTGTELTVVAADIVAGKMLILNHTTAPNLPVVWAVRMSMSIPLLWQEVVWDEAWGKYRGQDISGHSIVDGGLLSNFPLELFLSKDKMVLETMGPKSSEQVLGMLIDGTLAVENAPGPQESKQGVALDELPVVKRAGELVDTLLNAHDKMVMDSYADCVVHLPAKGYGITEFDMTEPRREALVNAGQKAMLEYFQRQEDRTLSFAVPEMPSAEETIDRIATKMLE